MRDNLNRILNPSSVAIVGASKDETKRGHQAIKTLKEGGFQGEIYPVNPNEERILGLPVYESICDIPSVVDLAMIATPSEIVPTVLDECGKANVAGAVIVAVGFSESGTAGEELETEISQISESNGIRFIGPNTSGMINVHSDLNLVGVDDVPPGNLALLCQSGNVAISLFTEADPSMTGFSYYIGVGNETDLKYHEYLPYFNQDRNSKAIVMYVEGLSDGRAFLEAARETIQDTPIVVLKGGSSTVGKRAANSHTASIAGDMGIAQASLRQSGVLTVDRSDELLPTASALANLPDATGENIGVISDGGGHATLAADSLIKKGLSVPKLSKETVEKLRNSLPTTATPQNPIDIVGGSEDDLGVVYECAEALIEDPEIDSLLITGLFGGYSIRFTDKYREREIGVAEQIADLMDDYGTPIVVHSAYAESNSQAIKILKEKGVQVHESLDLSTQCLHAVYQYDILKNNTGNKSDFQLPENMDRNPIIQQAVEQGSSIMSEHRSKLALSKAGVPITPFEIVESEEEAIQESRNVDGNVVMKIVSPDIIHKSEHEGVKIDIGENEVKTTYRELVSIAEKERPDANIEGVLVSPHRENQVELIVGATRNEQFGPVIMFGIGGKFVEILDDVQFRALPISRQDASSMISDIDSKELLEGARDCHPVDKESIVELLMDISEFVINNPEISELDLNPVFATRDGVEIVDALISLDSSHASGVVSNDGIQSMKPAECGGEDSG